jgi:hypothetical protein
MLQLRNARILVVTLDPDEISVHFLESLEKQDAWILLAFD